MRKIIFEISSAKAVKRLSVSARSLIRSSALPFVGFLMLAAAILPWSQVRAQSETDQGEVIGAEAYIGQPEYYHAAVTSVIKKGEKEIAGVKQIIQILEMRLLSGPDKGKEVEVDNTDTVGAYKPASVGEKYVVTRAQREDGTKYYIVDPYRLPSLMMIVGIFFGVVVFFGRKKGLNSIIGLGFSILVIALYIVPRVLQGDDPVTTTILGSLVIMFFSMYFAHGFNRRTTIALVSTLLALAVSGVLAVSFVSFARLFGTGSEAAFYLQFGTLEALNLRGLLLGGIIIGTLGVLDDITTAQVASVEEIGLANPRLSVAELYKRGISIGREHIASLVNTLALAYAGASLPLFLIFTINKVQPLWVILNGEPIAEELVRTLVGSSGLIIAVPISTWLAANYFRMKRNDLI